MKTLVSFLKVICLASGTISLISLFVLVWAGESLGLDLKENGILYHYEIENFLSVLVMFMISFFFFTLLLIICVKFRPENFQWSIIVLKNGSSENLSFNSWSSARRFKRFVLLHSNEVQKKSSDNSYWVGNGTKIIKRHNTSCFSVAEMDERIVREMLRRILQVRTKERGIDIPKKMLLINEKENGFFFKIKKLPPPKKK